jgi:hypothetical protein
MSNPNLVSNSTSKGNLNLMIGLNPRIQSGSNLQKKWIILRNGEKIPLGFICVPCKENETSKSLYFRINSMTPDEAKTFFDSNRDFVPRFLGTRTHSRKERQGLESKENDTLVVYAINDSWPSYIDRILPLIFKKGFGFELYVEDKVLLQNNPRPHVSKKYYLIKTNVDNRFLLIKKGLRLTKDEMCSIINQKADEGIFSFIKKAYVDDKGVVIETSEPGFMPETIYIARHIFVNLRKDPESFGRVHVVFQQ